MIEQIKDLLKHIENSDSQSEKIKSSLEVCALVFKNNDLDETSFKNLEAEDMILDSVLSMDEIVKFSSSFLYSSLKYLEADLKGGDFEADIEDNLKLFQELKIKFTVSTKKHKELSQGQEEAKKIKAEIDDLEVQIDEYTKIDLETIKLEKDQMIQRLVELEREEGNNLKSYKRHLEENEKINVFGSKLLTLSNEIRKDLTKMDESFIKLFKSKVK